MILFLLRRMLHAAVLVLVTLTATFLIIHLAPGDPLNRYYSPDIDPRVMDAVRDQLGLDRSLPVQYVKTLGSFLQGDFGVSIAQRRPVIDILRETVPRTLGLTGLALALQLVIGLLLGMFSASRRRSPVDKSLSVTFLVFYSMPSFYLAFVLVALFSLKLQWLPSAGMSSVYLDSSSVGELVRDRLVHLILPVTVLAVGSAAAFARYTRGSLLDVVNQEFVRTARAKGLAETSVMWKHVLKNAAPPIFTVIGLSIPFLLGGAVVVEKVFAWPGMGSLLVDSIFARDYPVVLAANFVSACMVILGSLLADLSYLWADPRIKLLAGASGGRA